METVTPATMERFLASSNLDPATKASLQAEFTKSGGDREIYNKAVRLSGRKVMTKVPRSMHTK